jgi:hypothetical protein
MLTAAGKTRALGYAWVGGFLSYTLRYAAAAYGEAGLVQARHPFIERFSVMDQVFGD